MNIELLRSEIKRLEDLYRGEIGIFCQDTESKISFGYRQDQHFPMASTFKVPICLALLADVDKGILSLDELIPITILAPGSGKLGHDIPVPGVSLTLGNLVELMLTVSDNTATDTVIRLLGGDRKINERLKLLDVCEVDVADNCHELICEVYGVDPSLSGREVINILRSTKFSYEEGKDTEILASGKNLCTPLAMAIVLLDLLSGKLLSEVSTEFLQSVMSRNQTGTARIPALLPKNTFTAEKTGTIGGFANDVGWVQLPSGNNLVVSCFARSNTGRLPEPLIAQVSRLMFDAFLLG